MPDSLRCAILISGGYLLGSISSAILVTRIWTGKDIRTLGNGNAGAANVGRSVGLLPASLVVLFDFSKGALPVLVGQSMGLSEGCTLAGAVAAVLGHSYPIYFHFRGGKGLAAALGALLALTPWETFLVLPVLGFVYLVLTGSAVTGALVSLLLLTGLNIWRDYSLVVILSPVVLLVAVGLGSLPEAIQGWRKQADKERLISDWLNPKETGGRKRDVAVVTDSLASLPSEIRARENVYIVPLTLFMPDGEYQDGVDMNASDYYRQLRNEGVRPKTSAPSPGKYLKLFSRLVEDHDIAIVLTPPKELTQTWDSARLAGEEAPQILDVYVVDTRVAGPAQGFVALAAARTVHNGAEFDTVFRNIQVTQENVGLIGVPETLNFLAESGRIKEVRGWVHEKIRVYPIITLTDGRVRVVGLNKTKKKAVNTMIQWLENNFSKEEIAMACFHTDALDEAISLDEKLEEILKPIENYIVELSPVIGAHVGPGMIGVAWWKHPILSKP